MKDFSIQDLLRVAKDKNYKIFGKDSKRYNVNIWGIRSGDMTSRTFNDLIVVFWKYQGNWRIEKFAATTDPGHFWLENPMSHLGTAIVKEGQYNKVWSIGLHQGKYEALRQVQKITVYRDDTRDLKLDLDERTAETGLFGINCHRANANGKSILVGKWSAGCQVLQNEKQKRRGIAKEVYQFDYFMGLCKKAAKNFGNSFTYTLINENDVQWKNQTKEQC